MANYVITMDSPIGILRLCSDEQHLKSISFDATPVSGRLFVPEILCEAKRQLDAYFSGELRSFELPLNPEGTEFQHRVWKQVAAVGFGYTKSYSEIACELKSANLSRAVGLANGRNPLPVIIPCHRIIGHNGKLTGYSGGLERKRWLLIHEQHSGIDTLFHQAKIIYPY